MYEIDGYRRRERGSFGGEFEASCCKQRGLCGVPRSCGKMCESIDMSFGVVSGVGRDMVVLEGVHVSQGKGDGF